MFNKVHVEKFIGLNSSVAPELVPDGAARDILNFRMEKVGKLISRNGVVMGLIYTNNYSGITAAPDFAPAEAYFNNKGIIGIGEFVLSKRWDEFDTDRLMVYAIRSGLNHDFIDYDNADVPTKSQEYKLAYLFAPMTGSKQDRLMIGAEVVAPETHNGIPVYERDKEPNGDMETTQTLYAANRDIADTLQVNLLSSSINHWIERYVHFNQFRNKLVISDRINGDMLLEDDFDRADLSACDTASHGLRLRPNCVDDFDIDDVTLDARMIAGGENDPNVGVQNGMALYKFILPKKITKATDDHFSNYISNSEWTGWDEAAISDELKSYSKVLDLMARGESSTLFNILWHREAQGSKNRIFWWVNHTNNSKNYYCFSTENTPVEFDDVLGELEFPKDEFVDQKSGKVKKQVAPDVYIWEDYRVKYYPCSGSSLSNGKFLNDLDRTFDKLQIGIPRALDLPEKDYKGDSVPLGVWRYRFVWDFGGGIYSAPSAEILCPDMLWSATKDDYIQHVPGAYARGKYLRSTVEDSDSGSITLHDTAYWHGQYIKRESPYNDAFLGSQAQRLVSPAIFNAGGDMNLTAFGELFFALKLKLYGDLNHRFGTKGWKTLAEVNGATNNAKGDFTTLVTTFFSKSTKETSGFIWEGAASRTSTSEFSFKTFEANFGTNIGSNKYGHIHSKGKLVIPIFQSLNNNCTNNSVFDNNGKLRLAYTSEPEHIKIQLMFPGINWGLTDEILSKNYGFPADLASDWRLSTMMLSGVTDAGHDSNVYLNVVCMNAVGASPKYKVPDRNNQFIDFELGDKRPHTILRAVNTELDRLTFTAPGIDAEAAARLVLTGTAEIQICSPLDSPNLGLQKYPYTVSGYDDHGAPTTTYDMWELDEINRESARQKGTITTFTFDDPYLKNSDAVESAFSLDDQLNLDIYIYGEGERFTGVEQLTAYFPSSLLYECPRIGIKIPTASIPRRAKRILIFRSKASHSNEFQANEYGLVETVDLNRNENGDVVTEDYMGAGNDYEGLYYFDKTKDKNLDFGVNPDEYEGLRDPIHSALNLPLNERVYYLNYKQTYQPIPPRMYETPDVDLKIIKNFTYKLFAVEETDEGFYDEAVDVTVKYKFLYRDPSGLYSKSVVTDSITIGAGTKYVVVFYYVPSTFDASVDKIEVYRQIDGGANSYSYIGEVLPEDEGVFVDHNQPVGKLFDCDQAIEITYPSGIMYSQPYSPNWIRPENTFEVRSGDGKQITAVHSMAGNLVIFKETSMHRITVQAVEPPLSRVDEVSPDIGCIAKNANVNVDNVIYFLSNKGFMRFDNNQIQKIDGPFDEELQFVLKHATEDDIRDISCGYNPYYNEIYLNIPMLKTQQLGSTEIQEEYPQTELGSAYYYESRNDEQAITYYNRSHLGHIYVINLDKQYATKFGYVPTVEIDPDDTSAGQYDEAGVTSTYRDVKKPQQLLKLYYTDSMGEMRSADIHPIRHKSIDSGKVWAGIYVETPHKKLEGDTSLTPIFTDADEILSPFVYNNGYIFDPNTDVFPHVEKAAYKVIFKSKFFTGEDESLIKRVRNTITNVFSRGAITLNNISIPRDSDKTYSLGALPDDINIQADDRIENNQLDIAYESFIFKPTINAKQPLKFTNRDIQGTGSNVLECVLRSPGWTNFDTTDAGENDWYGKPVRFSIEVEASLRTQLNSVAFNWRPIHTYLH